MMFRFLIISFSLFISIYGFAGDYAVSNISTDLLNKANAVVRKSIRVLDIKSRDNASISVKKVITVLNKNGDDHALFYAFYDKYKSVSNIKIDILDKNGDRVERIKESDVIDMSAVSGFSLYDDNRVVYYEPNVSFYPYSIEISYRMNYSGFIGFPDWFPVLSSDLSVEYCMYKVITNVENDIKFKENEITGKRTSKEGSNELVYEWQLSNLNAFYKELYSPPAYIIYPNVQIAPNLFNYGGEKGSLESWDQFGEWVGHLREGRGEVSEAMTLKISSLVEDAVDTTEMVKRIYEFVQANTRYVSIQMGIGGYQPFEAIAVEENGYGDCKALSNYTMALLHQAGIESNYTLVRAGSSASDVNSDFPSQQFNHVIINVPLQRDTIWLECTSQKSPFAYLGSFTDDRHVLSISRNNASLIKTPACPKEKNVEKCSASLSINESGDASGKINLGYSGLVYDKVFNFINEDKEEQRKWLYENIDISGLQISEFNTLEKGLKYPEAYIDIDSEIKRYASVSGKRMFIPIIPFEKLDGIPNKDEDRKFDIYLRLSKVYFDSVLISLPENYNLEYVPNDINLTTRFGSYQLKVTEKDKLVIAERKLIVNKGTFPKASYPEFVEFYQAIQKNDNSKVILKKKE